MLQVLPGGHCCKCHLSWTDNRDHSSNCIGTSSCNECTPQMCGRWYSPPKGRLKVAFDVDDTLIVPSVATVYDRDVPNYENIALYKWFQAQGHHMIIWSGGGIDYAKMWAEKLGLTADEYPSKEADYGVDLCFDDCNVKLAKVNVKVKRVNNNISRKDWNTYEKS